MNQKFLLLLKKHFDWSTEFVLQFPSNLTAMNQLEICLQNVDLYLNLKPFQLNHLIEKDKLASFIFCLKHYYILKNPIGSVITPDIESKFKEQQQNLLDCELTNEQFLTLNPAIFESYDILCNIETGLLRINELHHILVAMSFAYFMESLLKNASSNHAADSQYEDVDIDDDTMDILLNL